MSIGKGIRFCLSNDKNLTFQIRATGVNGGKQTTIRISAVTGSLDNNAERQDNSIGSSSHQPRVSSSSDRGETGPAGSRKSSATDVRVRI